MFKLFSCEWLRIRKNLTIAMAVHAAILALAINFGLFNSDAIGFKITLTLLYGACGYLFGYSQLKKYTQPGQWTYLINRPIGVKQIYLALFLTAISAFLYLIILPFFIATLALDFWQKEIIDLRHYMLLIYLSGVIIVFYLVACFAVLINKKSAHLLLMIAILPIISINMGGAVYLLLLVVITWLCIMVFSAVRVNLKDFPTGRVFQSTTALSYQYVIYFFIVSGLFFIRQIVLDVEHRTQETSQNQSFNSERFRTLIFLKPQDALITSLHTENDQYDHLIEEIKLNKTNRIRKRIWFHPIKQQLPFMDENKPVVVDTDNNIKWQFSHDLMMFIGKDLVSNKIVGYLGPKNRHSQVDKITENDIFAAVPWVQYNQIVVKNEVYRYQNNQQIFELVYSAGEDEMLLNGLQNESGVQAIITNKNLYLFDSIDYINDLLPLKNPIKIPLPGDYNNLWDIKITEISDRFILSFLYGKSMRQHVYDAEQLSFEFNLKGHIKLLNQRPLVQRPALLIKDLDYMISFAWKTMLEHFPTHPSRDRYLKQRPQAYGLSDITYLILCMLAIFYAVITLRSAKKRMIHGTKKWVWVLLNTVLGLPGVLTFMLLNPKRSPLINQPSIRGKHHV